MCSDDGVVADYSGAHGLEHVVLRALYVAGEEALIDLHGVFDHGRGAVFLAEEDVYALLRLEGGVIEQGEEDVAADLREAVIKLRHQLAAALQVALGAQLVEQRLELMQLGIRRALHHQLRRERISLLESLPPL